MIADYTAYSSVLQNLEFLIALGDRYQLAPILSLSIGSVRLELLKKDFIDSVTTAVTCIAREIQIRELFQFGGSETSQNQLHSHSNLFSKLLA